MQSARHERQRGRRTLAAHRLRIGAAPPPPAAVASAPSSRRSGPRSALVRLIEGVFISSSACCCCCCCCSSRARTRTTAQPAAASLLLLPRRGRCCCLRLPACPRLLDDDALGAGRRRARAAATRAQGAGSGHRQEATTLPWRSSAGGAQLPPGCDGRCSCASSLRLATAAGAEPPGAGRRRRMRGARVSAPSTRSSTVRRRRRRPLLDFPAPRCSEKLLLLLVRDGLVLPLAATPPPAAPPPGLLAPFQRVLRAPPERHRERHRPSLCRGHLTAVATDARDFITGRPAAVQVASANPSSRRCGGRRRPRPPGAADEAQRVAGVARVEQQVAHRRDAPAARRRAHEVSKKTVKSAGWALVPPRKARATRCARSASLWCSPRHRAATASNLRDSFAPRAMIDRRRVLRLKPRR